MQTTSFSSCSRESTSAITVLTADANKSRRRAADDAENVLKSSTENFIGETYYQVARN